MFCVLAIYRRPHFVFVCYHVEVWRVFFSGIYFISNNIYKNGFDAFLFSLAASETKNNFLIFVLMENNIPWSRPYLQLSGRAMTSEERGSKVLVKEDFGVTEFLLDTAKIRTFTTSCNTSKKWWLFKYLIVRSLRSFNNRPFYSCVLSYRVFDLEQGWRWPCCDRD